MEVAAETKSNTPFSVFGSWVWGGEGKGGQNKGGCTYIHATLAAVLLKHPPPEIMILVLKWSFPADFECFACCLAEVMLPSFFCFCHPKDRKSNLDAKRGCCGSRFIT